LIQFFRLQQNWKTIYDDGNEVLLELKDKTMKKVVLIVVIMLIVGCTATPSDSSEATYKAIYLTQKNGQISNEDLLVHPEVFVTSSFNEFKKLTENKTALWIDINAVGLVDQAWLTQKSQRFFPIVLVGYSDALCSFRDMLGGFGIIEGPYADCSSPPPGFSVWMLEEETSSGVSAFMQGYEGIPTVEDILEITNPLWSKP
jgi:hypothetical protein